MSFFFGTRPDVKSLSTLFAEKALAPSRCIHHATDVQHRFCSPSAGLAAPEEKLEQIVRHIVDSIAPAFKKAGVDTYWIWMNEKGDDPGFYFDHMPSGDEAIRKTSRSSFGGSDIDERLRRRRTETVFVSGFYANWCVWESALDSLLHGYNTIILTDCTDMKAMTPRQKDYLESKGAIFSPSDEVLEKVRLSL